MIKDAVAKIKSVVENLRSLLDPKFFSSIGAGFVRTELERPYDGIADQAYFKKIQEMPKSIRFAIKTLLYVGGAGVDKYVDEKTPIRKFFKDIAIDFPSEMAKRIESKTDTEIKTLFQNKSLAKILLDLDNNVLIELSELDDEERKRVIEELSKLEENELEKFIQLLPEQRGVILKLLASKQKSAASKILESGSSILGSASKGITRNINALGLHMEKHLEELKKGGKNG